MRKINRKTLYLILIALIVLTGVICWFMFKDVLVEMIALIRNGDEQQLSAFLAGQSLFTGLAALFLVSILQVVSIVLPGPVFQVAGAVIFGWWRSFLVCWTGFVCGNGLVFFLARFFGRSLTEALGLEQKNGWLLNKMNSADPRFVTALACMIPGIPNGIIPYVAQRCDMRLYSFVFAIAASSWINILLNCIAGHFLARGEYMFTFIAFALQLIILAVVALNKEKILGTDKKTEAQ
ncbi:MAG: VTT domain-containing protein [Solobacterium sp.]|nr:VTT domain-containing protein [Solobacterium sp.]